MKTEAPQISNCSAAPVSASTLEPMAALPADGQDELLDWDTTIDFPPAQEARRLRVRLVEVPDRPFETRPDSRD